MAEKLEGKSILLVDDDAEILSAMEVALAETGAKIHTARDGTSALGMAKSVDPDLIVLDMMLPRRSGFLVMESLQPKKQRGKRPFVIMITANEGKRHRSFALGLGADLYLQKPFSMDELLEKSVDLLRRTDEVRSRATARSKD